MNFLQNSIGKIFFNNFLYNYIPQICNRNIYTGIIHHYKITETLYAEPLKKKKRIDPGLLKLREDRKKKRLEKAVRILEKRGKILKPLIECEPEPKFLRELKIRERLVPILEGKEITERALLQKEWTRYKTKQSKQFMESCQKLLLSQERALMELKNESLDLYNEAIKLNENVLPATLEGPTNSPPFENYDSPDGEFNDITKTYIR